jgi:hypothetical protein
MKKRIFCLLLVLCLCLCLVLVSCDEKTDEFEAAPGEEVVEKKGEIETTRSDKAVTPPDLNERNDRY